MDNRKNLPCSMCGELMWRSRSSALEGKATCRPCRRATIVPRPTAEVWTCAACGVECARRPTKGQRPKWCDKCRARGARKQIECAHCGTSCSTWRKGRFCSRACASEAQRKQPKATGGLVYVEPAHPVCWLPSQHPVMRPKKKSPSRTLVAGRCAWCSAAFVVIGQLTARYCSRTCAAASNRAAHGRFAVPPNLRAALYERDKWVCQLCTEPVDRDLASTDPYHDWAPSLDHIVPRSKGGSDEPHNLRLAHRWCNAVRGAEDYHRDLFAA